MQKAEYMALKQQLSFEKPLWATLGVLAVDILLVWLAFSLLDQGSLPAWLLAQGVLTIFYFHNFALLHEAGHGNIHQKRWVNTLIGHYCSLFCFMPYFPWKLIHQEHHVWAGNIDKDPTMKNLKKMREKHDVSGIVRFAWKSWVPLAALLQHFVFWLYPVTLFQSGKMDKDSFLKSAFSVGLLAVTYYALFHFFPAQVNLSNLWLSFVLYLIVTELVNLPHHVHMPTFHTTESRNKLHPWEQQVTTRSCYYPVGISELLALNFNFHIEHHFFPSLPWYRLRTLRSKLKPMLNDYTEVVGIGWNLENRAKDPRDIVLPEVPHPVLQS